MSKVVDSLSHPEKIWAVCDLVRDVMKSGVYSEGEQTAEFEQAVMEYYGSDYHPTVAFSNCGAGLFTVFRWLLTLGHEKVVIANNTFVATASMAAEAGLIPVLCDSNALEPSMSVDSMINAVSLSGATVVCLTHVGGWLAKDYEAIAEYCQKHKIYLVEDAAHVFGVFNGQGHHAGALGDCAVFSFYPTKAVPGGEGGALFIKDSQSTLLDFALCFRSYGKWYDGDGVIRYEKGFNLRMSEFDAAVLRVQVSYTAEIMANRLTQATILWEAGLACRMGPPTAHSNYYKYPVMSVETTPRKQVGKIYSLSDQLFTSLRRYHAEGPVILKNSKLWAQTHACLPLGEHTYDGMSSKEIHEWISQE